jgi:MFS family permease
MLGSITSLGERGRGMRLGVTMAAFAIGAVAAGAALGAVLGSIGAAVSPGPAPGWVAPVALALVVAAGMALEAGRRLPSPRRQVNEDWLTRYRGWVYGVGFGAQLGAGVATVVNSAAIYAALAAALLSGSVAGGAAIGATLGGVRAATALPGRWVRTPAGLVRTDGLLRRFDRPVAQGSLVLQAAVAAVALAVVVA